MTLRSYQHLAVLDVARRWRAGERAVVLVIPTGGGKTHTAYEMVSRELEAGGTVLWMAHVDVLLEQSIRTARSYGHDPGVVKAKDRRTNLSRPLQVGSMQTVGRRLATLGRALNPTLIVVDEAHRAVANTYTRILDAWPSARVLGLTATPWRTDGRGLGEAFGAIVATTSPAGLVSQGFLVQPEIRAAAMPDLKGVRRRGGEYVASDIEERIRPGLGDVVRGVCEAVAAGRGPVAAFCSSVAHSQALRAAIEEQGVTVEHVDAHTCTDDRDALLSKDGSLASGAVQVVCSVGVLDEGVDCPALGTVCLAAPTASSSRYLQRVGRGLRTAAGKASCLVLDYGAHWQRHGHPLEDLRPYYSLDGAPNAVRAEAGDEPAQYWDCKGCYAILPGQRPPHGTPCPACGYVDPVPVVKVVDKGTVLRAVTDADCTPWAEKAGLWRELTETVVHRGYKWQWAAMRYKRRYGHWPSKRMIAVLKAAVKATVRTA